MPLEKLTVVASILLGVIHRKISVLDQCLAIHTVFGIGHDADARRDMQFVMIDPVRSAQGLEHLVGTYGRVVRVCHFGKQDHEFIAALAADRVRCANASEQPLCD